jgi:hypothetical protein
LQRADLDDFVTDYRLNHLRRSREDSDRFRCFNDEELAAHDELNLDVFWL